MLTSTGIEGIAVDLVAGSLDAVIATPDIERKHLVAGVVDGRNIWRNGLDASLDTLEMLA